MADSEETLHDQPHADARTAGIDPPTAFERHFAAVHLVVIIEGLVAVGEGRIRTGIITIRLAQSGGWHELADGDRVDLAERVEKSVRIAEAGERLAVTEMGMGVHDADLPAEVAGALGALEIRLRPAVIGQRTVEQMRAVGT